MKYRSNLTPILYATCANEDPEYIADLKEKLRKEAINIVQDLIQEHDIKLYEAYEDYSSNVRK